MSDNIMDTNSNKYTHLTLIERGKIEAYREENKGINEIARLLERSKSTISTEIKRGTVKQIKNGKEIFVYFADTAQTKYARNRKNSVCRSFYEKYSERYFVELETAIKERPRKHSVDSFTEQFKSENPGESVPSTSVVYRLIDAGELAIKSIHLPKKPSRKPKNDKPSKAKGTNKKVLGKSISERPEDVGKREEAGHYEADLVIGKKSADEPVLLTLVERKTRNAFVVKADNKCAETLRVVLEKLIKEVGNEKFKSITFDNGAEFSDMSEIKGVDIYFAHAYSAWERGSNENFNGLLREYIPKSVSIHLFSQDDINKFVACINKRPRKILKYKTAQAAFNEEFAA